MQRGAQPDSSGRGRSQSSGNTRAGGNTRGGKNAGGKGRGGGSGKSDTAFADQIKTLDQNGDGLSITELPEHMHNAFQIADADKSQFLDNQELLVLASQFRRNRLNPEANAQMKNAPVQPGRARSGGTR